MSHDEFTMISAQLDNIWSALNELKDRKADLDSRIAVIESRTRPDPACQKWVERKFVGADQFDQMHRTEHDAGRNRAISWGRVIQMALMGFVALAQVAVIIITYNPEIIGR